MKKELVAGIVATLVARSATQPGTLSRFAWVSKRQAQCLPPRPYFWKGEIDGIPVEVSFEDLGRNAVKMHWHPRQCHVEMRTYRNILLARGITPPAEFADDCPVRYGAPTIDSLYP